MSQLRGKCVICTSILTSDDIAALRCGHTFHFPCISEWIKRSDTCPICREWTAQCLMVKHLYFDCADDPNASQVEVPSAVQVESLSMALAQEKNKHAQAAEEVTRLKSLVDKLKVELAAAKKSYENKIQILEAWLNLRKCHKQTQDRLRACESQLDEARKTEQKLKDELKVERESVRALKKEEHELKNKVAILEKELRGVRGTAIIGSTPSNPKPRSLALDQRLGFSTKIFGPSKRVSLEFNESVELNADVSRKKKGEKVHSVQFEVKEQETRPGTSSVPKPFFVTLLDDEDKVEAATSNVSLEHPPSLLSIEVISFRPSPQNIRYHLRSRCVLKSDSPTGSGAVQGAAPKALTSLEKRDGSTDVISRKPGLKQRLNQNDLANQAPHFLPKRSLFDTITYDDKSVLF